MRADKIRKPLPETIDPYGDRACTLPGINMVKHPTPMLRSACVDNEDQEYNTNATSILKQSNEEEAPLVRAS